MDILLVITLVGAVVSVGGFIVAVVREREMKWWGVAAGTTLAMMIGVGFYDHPAGAKSVAVSHGKASTVAESTVPSTDVVGRKTRALYTGGTSGTSSSATSYESTITTESGMMCFDSEPDLANYEALYGDNDSFITTRFLSGEVTVPYGTSLRVLEAQNDGEANYVKVKVLVQSGDYSGTECWGRKSVEKS